MSRDEDLRSLYMKQFSYANCEALYIKNVLVDGKSICKDGNEAFGALGFTVDGAGYLITFIKEVLGPDEGRATAWINYGTTTLADPRGTAVLKLEGRRGALWRIIFFDILGPGTDIGRRAVAALVPTLQNEGWPREAIEDGDDLFWWNDKTGKDGPFWWHDKTGKWESCLIPHPFG